MCIKGKCAVHEPENIYVLIYSSVAYFSAGGSGPAAATPETSPGKHHFSSIWFNCIVSIYQYLILCLELKIFHLYLFQHHWVVWQPILLCYYACFSTHPSWNPILLRTPPAPLYSRYIWQLAGTRVLPGEPHHAAAVKARSYIATEIIKSFSCF